MQLIGVDYETFWSQDYTLSKLTTQEYVQHPDFRAHGASIKVDRQPAFWVGHNDLPSYFASVDWSRTAVLAHNCMFDGAILNWHYGVNPARWVDTLGMSRAVLGSKIPSHGLDRVSKFLGLQGKVRGGVLNDTKGIRVLSPEQEQRMGMYALDDIEDTRRVFDILAPHFPVGEYATLDWTIRCFVDRTLELDPAVCIQAHRDEIARKQQVFEDLSMGDPDKLRSVVNSNAQFAKILNAMLEPYGEAAPQKLSAATGKPTWAFGKTDEEFTNLVDHEDERVAMLVQARLDTKGALAETRAVKLLHCVRYDAQRRIGCGFNYSGAVATHRLSGAGGTNFQNMPRLSPLKKALRAPKGHVVIDVDLSQIELRTGALLVGQMDIVQQLKTGGDTYSTFASQVYERPIDKKNNPDERQVGKVAVLSCQYGVAQFTFRKMLRVQAGLIRDLDFCKAVVDKYREFYPMYPKGWGHMRHCLAMWAKGQVPDEHRRLAGPLDWSVPHEITLPSGLKLKYPDLDQREVWDTYKGERVMSYTFESQARGKSVDGRQKIYAAMLFENLCIAEGTDVLTDSGWVPIESVTRAHLVWNGEMFAPHGGLVDKATKQVISVAGVRMTPDHLVRSDAGWVEAQYATEEECVSYGRRAAPQRAAPDGADLRDADGYGVVARCARQLVELPVRVRGHEAGQGGQLDEREHPLVRMPRRGQIHARHVEPPGVLGVALDGGPLHAADAPSVEELRGPGGDGVPRVAGVPRVLGGHGGDVRLGPDAGEGGQRAGIFARELPLGDALRTGQQPAELAAHRHSVGRDDREAGVAQVGHRELDPPVPAGPGVHARGDVAAPESRARVFDILDVAGTNAFLVRCPDRRLPLIVHNCQALAAEVMRTKTKEIIKYLPAPMQVHDALTIVAPEAQAEEWATWVRHVFSSPVDWWPELPVACEVGYAHTYGDVKKS